MKLKINRICNVEAKGNSIEFDKIYPPGPRGLSLVHPKELVWGAVLLGAVVL